MMGGLVVDVYNTCTQVYCDMCATNPTRNDFALENLVDHKIMKIALYTLYMIILYCKKRFVQTLLNLLAFNKSRLSLVGT